MRRVFNAAVLLIFLLLGLNGCASGRHLGIPGEHERLNKNICSEYYAIAEGYVGVKNYTKAAEYYKLAMRDKNIRLTAYYKMGRAYALAKDWDNALDVYDHLIKRDKDNLDLAESIAYITAMKGDISSGIAMYKDLSEKHPENQTLLENHIALLIADGKGELAESQLAILKSRFPDSKKISDFKDKIASLVDNPEGSKDVSKTSDLQAPPSQAAVPPQEKQGEIPPEENDGMQKKPEDEPPESD